MAATNRVRLVEDDYEREEEDTADGNYFVGGNSDVEFISTGCAVLDCTVGGGWPLRRIVNIVGDESTGKTLLAIEACANFHIQYPKGEMFYREAEDAFDESYAAALGMPVDQIRFAEPGTFVTVEDFHEDFTKAAELVRRKNVPGIYIVDSLDAITSVAEIDRDFGEASYDLEKAKQIGKLLRLCTREVARSNMLLIIISQTRDNISAMAFGKKKRRSGGKALNFYASQCVWLSHLKTVVGTRGGSKRPVGIRIKAKCEKNKIALPYRTCEFTITFGHGIDSLASDLEWLAAEKRLRAATTGKLSEYRAELRKMSDEEYWQETARVDDIVKQEWRDIDARFLEGVRPKYRFD